MWLSWHLSIFVLPLVTHSFVSVCVCVFVSVSVYVCVRVWKGRGGKFREIKGKK